jgi:hypothetical protein
MLLVFWLCLLLGSLVATVNIVEIIDTLPDREE